MLVDSPQSPTLETPAATIPESRSASRPRLFSSGREATLLAALLLALTTLVLYQQSLRNEFVSYDDPAYITANPIVQQGLTWHNVEWAFLNTEEDNWHPVTWLSHMADIQMFGLKPTGHHLMSLLLHIINVLLLFQILQMATGYITRSAVVAGLFAFLPLNAESVAWVAERKSVLSTAFLLLALLAYGFYVKRPGILRYLAVLALFALGLMSKPMVITLPVLLLLADYWPLDRLHLPGHSEYDHHNFSTNLRKLIVEKIPMFILSAGSAIVTVYAQRQGHDLVGVSQLAIVDRLKNAMYSYFSYILKALWPVRLAVFYPYPRTPLALWKTALAAFVLLAITTAVLRYRAKRYLLAGWLWYLIALIPVIGIVQVGRQARADRYAYLPFIGLFIIAVWLAADLTPKSRNARGALAAISFVVLGAYFWTTQIQIGYWRDSYTLFSHALRVTRQNPIAENDFGCALVDRGDLAGAEPHFVAAIGYLPDYSTAHYNLGHLFQVMNRTEDAEAEYQRALAFTRDSIEAGQIHNNLALLYLHKGNKDLAMAEYNASLKANPDEMNGHAGRGVLEYQQGNLAAAQADLSLAVRLDPTPSGLYWLGRVLEDKGDLSSSSDAYAKALQMDPNNPETKAHLDGVQGNLRREH